MSDEQSISDGQLGRIQGDLAIMQRAMGLHLYFGSGILVFSILLSVAALIAAFLSLIFDSSWLQVVDSLQCLLTAMGRTLNQR